MATYYWVGGDGTWDASSTTNWSATSGGAGGAGAPNNTDTVIFDSASGTGTCTTASGSACAIATLNSSTLELKLGANHTMSGTFTLTLGALNLDNNTLTSSIFSSSNTNIRAIVFGASGKIILTGNATTVWSVGTATNFTYTGTSYVESNYSGGTGNRGFSQTTGATESNSVNIYVTAGTDTITGTLNVKTFNLTGFTGTVGASSKNIYGDLILSSGLTWAAATNILSFLSTTSIQKITTNNTPIDQPITKNGAGTLQLQDNLTMGSTRTFTLTAGTLDLVTRTLSTGIFSSTNSNVRSIAFGTGNITLTGNNATIWTTSTATNFTVTGTPVVNATYAGSTGTRVFSVGNAGVVDLISLNISAGTDTVSVGLSTGSIKDLNFTGFNGTLSASTRRLFGNLTFSAGMTVTGGATITTFAGTSGIQQITTNGIALDIPLTFDGVGGTFSFQDALTQGSTRAFTLTAGIVQLKNGVTSTVGSFVANNSSVKFLQSTTPGSQATLSQASGTVNVVDLTIRDINAVGGAAWNAYTDFENTDAGNNDGWNFSLSPPYSIAELPITLRPFTQPRRF
jgi:hypothetical protein